LSKSLPLPTGVGVTVRLSGMQVVVSVHRALAMGIFADGDRNDEPKCCVGKCRLSSDPYSARV
jgi:hypothetical protein